MWHAFVAHMGLFRAIISILDKVTAKVRTDLERHDVRKRRLTTWTYSLEVESQGWDRAGGLHKFRQVPDGAIGISLIHYITVRIHVKPEARSRRPSLIYCYWVYLGGSIVSREVCAIPVIDFACVIARGVYKLGCSRGTRVIVGVE